MSKRIRLTRLLDRGFYPAELPPTFKTNNYASLIGTLAPPRTYVGSTTSFDGATFRGHLRTFGVINPVSYYLLSDFIAQNWGQIAAAFKLSSCSGSRPTFPRLHTAGRAIGASSLSAKRKTQQHLASVYPVILSLDLNRFYGSIYTHAIPWAVLGKEEAKRQHRARTLSGHWSDALDVLVRGCNQKQTVGVPIGPDTSRIISELILSRIDFELTGAGSGLRATQIYHAIDDYQFGVMSQHEAEEAESKLVRVVSRYGHRLNDFKKSIKQGLAFAPSNFQIYFDGLNVFDEKFVDHFFEILYARADANAEVNVVGYALKRFARALAASSRPDLVQEYLQRLLYAVPHQARFVFPLLLGIYRRQGVSPDVNRLVKWGIEICSRRNDVGNVLWFLYAALFLRSRIGASLCAQCVSMGNELVDLVLMHGRNEGLFAVETASLRRRYSNADLSSPAWLPLYEVERRGWDGDRAFRKIGTADDPGNHYDTLRRGGAEFYMTGPDRFTVEAFDGWGLTDRDFRPRDLDELDFRGLWELDGREVENYE